MRHACLSNSCSLSPMHWPCCVGAPHAILWLCLSGLACMARSDAAQRRHDLRCWTTMLLQCNSESVWTSSSVPVMEPEQWLAPALIRRVDTCGAIRQAVHGVLGWALLCNPGVCSRHAPVCACACAAWIDASSAARVASLSLRQGSFQVGLSHSLCLSGAHHPPSFHSLLFLSVSLSVFLSLPCDSLLVSRQLTFLLKAHFHCGTPSLMLSECAV